MEDIGCGNHPQAGVKPGTLTALTLHAFIIPPASHLMNYLTGLQVTVPSSMIRLVQLTSYHKEYDCTIPLDICTA